MRDTRIEDQLRDVLRTEADTIPFTLTAAELERGLRLRRARRANQRILLEVAAALVIAVGAGAAVLLSNRANNPTVATSPSPSIVAASASVLPRETTSPPPSAGERIGLDGLPAIDELVGAAQASYPGFVPVADEEWDGSNETDYAPGEIANLGAGEVPLTNHYVAAVACAGDGSFEYLIGDERWRMRTAGTVSRPCDPSATVTEIADVHVEGDIPLGVSIRVEGRAAWRIVILVDESRKPSTSKPKPHEPTLACKPAGSRLPDASLSVKGADGTVGELGTTSWTGYADDVPGDVIPGNLIHAKVGDRLQIRIAGDVCASSWGINYGIDVTEPNAPGSVVPVWYFVPSQENAEQDLGFAAENRFASTAREGDWIIHAGLVFPDGGGSYYWHVVVEP
jgi:hypothetical protein